VAYISPQFAAHRKSVIQMLQPFSRSPFAGFIVHEHTQVGQWISVRSRIRPIYMSSITTVCAMMPLVLSPGAGSEFYRGLGSVVVGGILISTVFTIFLIPALLSLTFDAIGLFKRISNKFFRPQGKDTT